MAPMQGLSIRQTVLSAVVLSVSFSTLDDLPSTDSRLSIDETIVLAIQSSERWKSLSYGEFECFELDMLFHQDTSSAIARKKRRTSYPRMARGAEQHNLVRKWPNALVTYTIDANFNSNDLKILREVIDHYHNFTCIRFREAAARDTNNVNIVEENVICASHVGYNPPTQELHLPLTCRKKEVIFHELGHTIGLVHEHSRLDRDDYVSIKFENINEHLLKQFDSPDASRSEDTWIAYDYKSIMHYSQRMASKNGSLTIVARDPNYQNVIGNQKTLSFRDIKRIQWMYNCSGRACRRKFCPGEGFIGMDCLCWCPAAATGTVIEQCPDNEGIITIELDMLFLEEQWDSLQARSNTIQMNSLSPINDERLWLNATIPYVLGGNFSDAEEAMIKETIEQFHRYSCIQIRPRRDKEEDYLDIVNTNGCSSFVGRKGGAQPLSLASWCIGRSMIAHELVHAVGLMHEQEDQSGNGYVNITLTQIQNFLHDFVVYLSKSTFAEVHPGRTYYEYERILHRMNFIESKEKVSVRSVEAQFLELIGQETGLKDSDLKRINKLYNCSVEIGCQPQQNPSAELPISVSTQAKMKSIQDHFKNYTTLGQTKTCIGEIRGSGTIMSPDYPCGRTSELCIWALLATNATVERTVAADQLNSPKKIHRRASIFFKDCDIDSPYGQLLLFIDFPPNFGTITYVSCEHFRQNRSIILESENSTLVFIRQSGTSRRGFVIDIIVEDNQSEKDSTRGQDMKSNASSTSTLGSQLVIRPGPDIAEIFIWLAVALSVCCVSAAVFFGAYKCCKSRTKKNAGESHKYEAVSTKDDNEGYTMVSVERKKTQSSKRPRTEPRGTPHATARETEMLFPHTKVSEWMDKKERIQDFTTITLSEHEGTAFYSNTAPERTTEDEEDTQ